ncbi:MAG: acyltransferase, partial [Ilumatobacter sp.]|nr:acyltransferase [Ilumatobacter sp.]
ILQVANWVFLAGEGSYQDLFQETGGARSPLEHYWSLAIEEQFYWVWPPTFAALAVLARRRGWPLVRVLAVPTVAFVALGPAIAAAWGPDAAYWATPARIGEILTGATAAALVADRGSPAWTRRATPAALVAVLAACVAFPTVGGPAYGGWLPALSTVTAVLLLGLQHPGPVRRALSVRPLVALGAISYGVYLFHWPIFVVVDEARLGTGGAVLFAVRVALTLAVAIASYRLVEQPVRRLRTAPRPTLIAGLGLTAACVALVAVVPRTGTTIDTAGDDAAGAAIRTDDPVGPLTVA